MKILKQYCRYRKESSETSPCGELLIFLGRPQQLIAASHKLSLSAALLVQNKAKACGLAALLGQPIVAQTVHGRCRIFQHDNHVELLSFVCSQLQKIGIDRFYIIPSYKIQEPYQSDKLVLCFFCRVLDVDVVARIRKMDWLKRTVDTPVCILAAYHWKSWWKFSSILVPCRMLANEGNWRIQFWIISNNVLSCNSMICMFNKCPKHSYNSYTKSTLIEVLLVFSVILICV